MKNSKSVIVLSVLFLCFSLPVFAAGEEESAAVVDSTKPAIPLPPEQYTAGSDDILEIVVLQPDRMEMEVTVSPDGYISFPYIGSVLAKDHTLDQIRSEIETKLADGFMKYPVVSVTLKMSRSKRFFVYGEVTTPGAYPHDPAMTVFRALSVAGGFTKFGSSSRVKLMRLRSDGPGYEMIKIDVKAIMNGSNDADLLIQSGDVVVVSEGII